jgi:hypothetical protein
MADNTTHEAEVKPTEFAGLDQSTVAPKAGLEGFTPDDAMTLSTAMAIELVRVVLGTPEEAEIAAYLRKQLVANWQQSDDRASRAVEVLFEGVRSGPT